MKKLLVISLIVIGILILKIISLKKEIQKQKVQKVQEQEISKPIIQTGTGEFVEIEPGQFITIRPPNEGSAAFPNKGNKTKEYMIWEMKEKSKLPISDVDCKMYLLSCDYDIDRAIEMYLNTRTILPEPNEAKIALMNK